MAALSFTLPVMSVNRSFPLKPQLSTIPVAICCCWLSYIPAARLAPCIHIILVQKSLLFVTDLAAHLFLQDGRSPASEPSRYRYHISHLCQMNLARARIYTTWRIYPPQAPRVVRQQQRTIRVWTPACCVVSTMSSCLPGYAICRYFAYCITILLATSSFCFVVPLRQACYCSASDQCEQLPGRYCWPFSPCLLENRATIIGHAPNLDMPTFFNVRTFHIRCTSSALLVHAASIFQSHYLSTDLLCYIAKCNARDAEHNLSVRAPSWIASLKLLVATRSRMTPTNA